ncbi:MAG: histidine kinase, partial [Ferruginibacter sp.]
MEKNEIAILIYTFAIILIVLGVFSLLFYFLFKQKQKTHLLKISALNEQLLTTQIEIQEQTLRNVSQELHDNIGQVLSLVKLNLGTFPKLDKEAEQKVYETRSLVSKALVDLRQLASSMYGDKIAEIGLQDSVKNELKFLQSIGKFETHLTVAGEQYDLKPKVQMVIFRIIQEAIHNDIKHSKAKNIYVDFDYGLGFFTVQLRDDGVGFDIN